MVVPLNSMFDELEAGSGEKASILIVDDLPEKILVIETILEELGQNLVVARSGSEALREVLKREFAVVLLDVNMPDIDGMETARLMRSYRRAHHTPIIFMTAYADEFQTAQGYSLGAVDYILAPIIPEILRSKVRVFVELHKMQRQLRVQAAERVALVRAEAAQKAAEENTRRSNFLSQASRALAGSLNVDVGMHRLLELIVPQRAERATLCLLGDERGPDRVVVCESAPAESEAPRRMRDGGLDELDPLVREALQTLAVADPASAPLLSQAVSVPASFMPMMTGNRVLGALIVEGAHDDVGHETWDELAHRASMAFENARLYSVLQHEIVERRLAQSELSEASQRKDEFLAMLAHELRNPLAPIRNAAAVVRRLTSGADGRVSWALDVTERQVNHLAQLVDELLDVARIGQGKIALRSEPVDLQAVIAQGVETVSDLVSKRKHQLILKLPPEPVWLLGDVARLTQVVANLLHNAAKYTEESGVIELGLQCKDDKATLTVRDNGVGIDADLLPHVFELFEQGERSLDRSQGGLGLGLTLVQRLVELHHGSVAAHSDGIGLGATFTVVLPGLLPAQPSPELPAPTSSAIAPGLAAAHQACRILVVEDNADIAETIVRYLEMAGHQVQAVSDGTLALEAGRSAKPEVVILDIGLPGIDGFEVARRMRAMPECAHALLIAMTGYGQAADRLKTRMAGFDAHLVKPTDPEALVRLIGEWRAGRGPAQGPVAAATT